jgi:exonuclease SbcD
MRFLHLADLHLGRTLGEYSLFELQKELLTQIINDITEKKIDAVVIAGDVYDRSMPSLHAVELLNGFLSALAAKKVPVLMISGNHDSAERLSFLSSVLGTSGIYIAGEYTLGAAPVTLEDEHGKVNFYLLPFFRPGAIRSQAEGVHIEDYNDAVRVAVEHMKVNTEERNVLLAHHFVCTGGVTPMQSESETPFIGGLELVEAANFEAFDYVALGHLHQPQKVGRESVRYAGSPIKYSMSEVHSNKSYVIVELGEKGDMKIELVPIRLSVDLRSVRGLMDDIMSMPASENDGDFLAVQLTDIDPVYDAMQRLKTRYPRVISVRRERDMMSSSLEGISLDDVRELDPLTLFENFYKSRSGVELTENERKDIVQAIEEIRGEERA